MRIVLTILLTALLLGCETTPWVRGSIAEGLPRLVEKFPPKTTFFVAETERRVKRDFEKALRVRGFRTTKEKDKCDVVVKVTVDSWEYNDIGFGGKQGPRDDMELSVVLIDPKKKRILSRSRISLRSDFRIIQQYVDGLR